MPTAIPVAPFTRRFGKRAGRTTGSKWTPSKFGRQSTVFLRISESSSIASGLRRASVYRYAAAASPSREPKLPCPSTRGARSENGCAMRTIAS